MIVGTEDIWNYIQSVEDINLKYESNNKSSKDLQPLLFKMFVEIYLFILDV